MSEAADRIMEERGEQWGPILESWPRDKAIRHCLETCEIKAQRAQYRMECVATQGWWTEENVRLVLDCLRDLQNYAAIAEKRMEEVYD